MYPPNFDVAGITKSFAHVQWLKYRENSECFKEDGYDFTTED